VGGVRGPHADPPALSRRPFPQGQALGGQSSEVMAQAEAGGGGRRGRPPGRMAALHVGGLRLRRLARPLSGGRRGDPLLSRRALPLRGARRAAAGLVVGSRGAAM
ncbi:MAG: hypothetical protein AVDCRST_MAG65-2033, partial [uncultured Solirubrobacteraceae bacterium]